MMLAAATVLVGAPSRADEPLAPTPAEQFTKLAAEFDKIDAAARGADDGKRQAIQDWRQKALALIRQHPAEPNALPVIQKYLTGNGTEAGATKDIIDIVRKHHMADAGVSRLVRPLYSFKDASCWKFALEIADTSPNRDVRGRAALTIGQDAKLAALQLELPGFSDSRIGEDKRALLAAHAETYLGKAAKEYADVRFERASGTVGQSATKQLAQLMFRANLKVGKPVPDIDGVDLAGEKLKLSDHRGRVVLLVFWASWCGPCMADVPHEREIVEKFEGRPFTLIGVSGDRELTPAKAAVERAKISWRTFAPNNLGKVGGIPDTWGIIAWPQTYVIDHTGVIRHINLRREKLDQPLEDLVAAAEEAKKAGAR
jgi:peroxiredoxin